jgi:site-specific DNA recombinase
MYPNHKARTGLLAIRVSSGKQKRDGDSPEEQRQRGESLARNQNVTIVDTVILVESASHAEQPMQAIVEHCRANPAIEVVLIKAIDRFTRGGSAAYIKLKEQLDALNVTLVDTFGIIDSRRVNTLEHTGFQYYWSDYSPSFKSEILEAEHAKDELRDIMTRMIGAQIRYTQLGYWMRRPPFGFVSEMVDTDHGKRMILKPHPEESKYIVRLFEMRAKGIYSSREIADHLNQLGFKTRINHVRDKYDRSKIKRTVGGCKMDEKLVDRITHNVIYAGVIKEKWTHDKPVKAQFEGLVSIDLFNQANHGKLVIEASDNNEIKIHHKSPPKWQQVKQTINPKFPYKKVISCPHCNKPLSASAARGKLGKYYPAYHCSRDGHYFRKPQAEFDATIKRFVNSVEIAPEHIDTLLDMIKDSWLALEEQTAKDSHKLLEQRQGLETQIRTTVDRMKMISSETAIKYMEEDIITAEKQIAEIDQAITQQAEKEVDIDRVLQYAKYLLKHLSELVFDLSNPLRQAAFFGIIFNTMPSYAQIDFETHENSPLPEVNGLFRLVLDYKSTFGGPSGTRTHDTLLKRQVL